MTQADVFLEARNVSVSFPLPVSMLMTDAKVGGRIIMKGRRKELLATDNISFRLDAGDTLAFMGHNGSGKTTLLRVLAGILQPSSGVVLHKGTLGNALNTSIGFRSEATGRHNIGLKALIAGQKRKELPRIIEDVEEFAELGPFLDLPMHTYSAGMRARLAFGIATAFRYDILILDEWLGAGDRQMQEKAAQRMQQFVVNSAITVLASHNNNLLSQVCNKGIILDHGRVLFAGDIAECLEIYEGIR